MAVILPVGETFQFDTKMVSTTALATPSALAATAFNAFASTVSGAVLMGFGTTHDVALKNRAGTTVIGVGPNTTTVTFAGAATGITSLDTTGTVTSTPGSGARAFKVAGGAFHSFFDAAGPTEVVRLQAIAGVMGVRLQAAGQSFTVYASDGNPIAAFNDTSKVIALSGTVTGLKTSNSAYIGGSSNANATLGLTINQGAADDEIAAWKSSDIAHGVTTLTETDTFFFGKKLSATNGGVNLAGISASLIAIQLSGVSTAEDATRSTAAGGSIYLNALKKSGTTTTALAADKNMVVFANNGTGRFIFDTDGDGHADVSWTTF